MTQLRIKRDRLLDPATLNLYIRGDGTRVYYFEKHEMEAILTRSPRNREGKMFEIDQLEEDRRMVSSKLMLGGWELSGYCGIFRADCSVGLDCQPEGEEEDVSHLATSKGYEGCETISASS